MSPELRRVLELTNTIDELTRELKKALHELRDTVDATYLNVLRGDVSDITMDCHHMIRDIENADKQA